MRFSRSVTAAAVGVLALSLSACGKTETQETTDNSGNQVLIDDKTLTLVGETYPLQYVLQEVAGDGFAISSLTTGAKDARTSKVSGADSKAIGKADLVLTMDGFNPAVDRATKGRKNVMNVNSTVNLKKMNGATDYHFWLDPSRMATLSDAVAAKLGQIDPPRAGTYTQNAEALDRELLTLDTTVSTTLATCKIKNAFTQRPDFGYLGEGTPVKFHGLFTRDGAGRAATLASRVRAADVTTIYGEPSADTADMQRVADLSNTGLGSLDPLETLTDGSVGDYMDAMSFNVKMLSKGQKCKAIKTSEDPAADDDAGDDTDTGAAGGN